MIGPAHLNSLQKAVKAFENFSLSKFAKDEVPENYIDPRNVHDPKAVQDAQRDLISRHLRKLPDTDTRNSGVTITFPVAALEEVKMALPGMTEHGGDWYGPVLCRGAAKRVGCRTPVIQSLLALADPEGRDPRVIASWKLRDVRLVAIARARVIQPLEIQRGQRR